MRFLGFLAAPVLVLAQAVTAQTSEPIEWVEEETGPDVPISVRWDGDQLKLPASVQFHTRNGRWDVATPYYRRLLEAHVEQLGENDPATLDAANKLGIAYLNARLPVRAVVHLQEWLPKAEAAMPSDDPFLLSMQANLAGAYNAAGHPALAVDPAKRAADALEASLGPEDRRSIGTRNIHAIALFESGKVSDAMSITEDVLQRANTVFGERHPFPGTIRSNLGNIYRTVGRYEQAEDLLRRQLDEQDVAIVGSNPPEYFETLSDIASLEFEMGRFDDALRDIGAAEAGLLEYYPSSNGLIQEARNVRGNIMLSLGRYAEAEPIMLGVLDIREETLGARHPNTLTARRNLASLYRTAGRFEEAESLFRQVMLDAAETLGENHPATLSALNGLAVLTAQVDGEAASIRIYEPLVERLEDSLGADHPQTLAATNNLAGSYARTGDTTKAVALLEDVSARSSRIGGMDNFDTLEFRLNLAGAYRQLLRLRDAEEILADLLPRYRSLLGPDHPKTIRTAAALAGVRARISGEEEGALVPAREAVAALERRRHTGASLQQEEQAASETIGNSFVYRTLADSIWAASGGNPDEQAVDEALLALQLSMEGSASRSIAQMATRRYAGEAGVRIGQLAERRQSLSDRYAAINDRIAEAVARGDEAGRTLARELQTEQQMVLGHLDSNDAELRALYPEYFNLIQPQPLDRSELQALVAEDEAGLILVPGLHGSHVAVIRHDRIIWRKVGIQQDRVEELVRRLLWDVGSNVEPTDEELDQWLAEDESGYPFDRASAWELYRELIGPIESDLAGASGLYVAAGGSLSALPASILVTAEPQGPDGDPASLRSTSWLAEKFAVSQIPSFQALQFLRTIRENGEDGDGGLIGFGDPVLADAADDASRGAATFGRPNRAPRRNAASTTRLVGGLDSDGQPGALLESIRALSSLPGTARELATIQQTLGLGADRFRLREEATEANFRASDLASASTIIIATHGLVAGEIGGVAEPGLVFTPPETFTGPADDGLLTASEITGLRINADWVLLSACNTAAGDSRRDDSALSGLARAFFYSGAQSLLASYWPVRDDVGAIFAARLLELEANNPEISRAEALQQTMREIRNDESKDAADDSWAHPAAWAPFAMIGDGAR